MTAVLGHEADTGKTFANHSLAYLCDLSQLTIHSLWKFLPEFAYHNHKHCDEIGTYHGIFLMELRPMLKHMQLLR